MKKHFIIIIIALAFVLALAGCQTQTGPVYTTYYDELGRPWAIVTGGGNTSYTKVTLKDVYGDANVEIIGEEAFLNCVNLVEINIPRYVTHIELLAFKNCSSLPKITLPQSLVFIGPEAFRGCAALKELTIPDKVTDIKAQAFKGCSGLKTVKMPAFPPDDESEQDVFLDIIREELFAGCFALESIQLPGGIKTILSSAFENCFSLKNVNLPEGLIDIGSYAYSGCSSLEKIELPANLKSLGAYAFSDCSSLSEVVINGYETPGEEPGDTDNLLVGNNAFSGCGIKKLTVLRAEVINFAAFDFNGDLTGLSINVLPEVYDDYLSDSDWGVLADYISIIE